MLWTLDLIELCFHPERQKTRPLQPRMLASPQRLTPGRRSPPARTLQPNLGKAQSKKLRTRGRMLLGVVLGAVLERGEGVLYPPSGTWSLEH